MYSVQRGLEAHYEQTQPTLRDDKEHAVECYQCRYSRCIVGDPPPKNIFKKLSMWMAGAWFPVTQCQVLIPCCPHSLSISQQSTFCSQVMTRWPPATSSLTT
jgi:hypothetical protein